jgi:hypothetical protein
MKKKQIVFLAGLLVVSLAVILVTRAGSAKPPMTFIAAGDDGWVTGNDGQTHDQLNVPAGFFNPGSDAYTGTVVFKGKPLTSGSSIDTIVTRQQDVVTPGSTALLFKSLSLVSVSPITVTYSGGSGEEWDVAVGLSQRLASTGSMTIKDDGTFSSTLSCYPRFTFTRRSDGAVRTLDTGSAPIQMELAGQAKEWEAEGNAAIPAPCKADETTLIGTNAATTGCAPLKFQGNGSWTCCPFRPRPLTEQELLARHGVFPPTPTPTPCRRAPDGGKNAVIVPCPVVE